LLPWGGLTKSITPSSSIFGSFPRFEDADHIGDFSKPICNASGHRWRRLERLMAADEIVMEEVQRHRVRVVFHLF
jgi:hypothetical protein